MKKKQESSFILHLIYPKWIIDVPMKGETIEFPENNIEEYLQDLGIS